jgi:hypothetical protein
MATIGYDIKDGIKYAKITQSRRINGQVKTDQVYLGRVLDQKRSIYKNRDRGIFTYDPKTDTYSKPPASFVPPKLKRKRTKENLILDFGDSFFLSEYIKLKGLKPSIDALSYGNPDSLYAMIYYYFLCNMANCHAETWYEGNFVRELYPGANLSSQRISDLLMSIGDEWSQREFFSEYLDLVAKRKGGDDILIDSTGLPNSIHFPLTAIRNHNGVLSNEVRLIYVVQQHTELPLFFRYCPGNVIDISTLQKTLLELKAYNVNIKYAILDAGYLDDLNIRELYANKISFLSRMKKNRNIYKQLVDKHLNTIESKENLVEYNGRYVYIVREKCEIIDGCNAYVYLCKDITMRSIEATTLFANAKKKKMSTSEVYDALEGKGIFALFSSRPIAKEKLLSTYYMRVQIEQIFDIVKNYTNLLPLRVQKEETFHGHLVLVFIASILAKMLQIDLRKTGYTIESALLNLRNQKCKVFERNVLPQESVKKVNDIYKKFNLACPNSILRKEADEFFV